MKNIHLLSTSQPSRLFTYKDESYLYYIKKDIDSKSKNENCQNQNIYITSDEEIKEGDWFITKGEVFKCTLVTEFIWRNNFDKFPSIKIDCKKIILTTDQDLIDLGVQSIDGEFLQWYIKNPSCEEVDIVNKGRIGIFSDGTSGIVYNKYKIIIPKEEPKQSIKDIILSETSEEVKQRVRDTANKLVMIQETLEEATEKYVTYCAGHISEDEDLADADRRGFIYGAKWQQERSYSEKEVFAMLVIKHDGLNPEYVLEQFKKK